MLSMKKEGRDLFFTNIDKIKKIMLEELILVKSVGVIYERNF